MIPFCACNSVGYREQVRVQMTGVPVADFVLNATPLQPILTTTRLENRRSVTQATVVEHAVVAVDEWQDKQVAKEEISVAVDAAVLANADADAKAAGLNGSELVEQALRNEHLRRALHDYTTRAAPALNIDAYAEQVYQANRAAGV